MADRSKVLVALIKYFNEKGRVLSPQEYAREQDAPVRAQQIKALFGSWGKMERLVMAREAKTSSLDVNELIKARNEAEWDAVQAWREASENQDAKAEKEAQAQAVAETLAKNAATPEGANANKIAIGGKLPSEQQDYSAMRATVEVDPKSGEQKIVDVNPELIEPALDGQTPLALKEAAKAKAGTQPVDKSTAGGSTGTPSKDTVNAIATPSESDKKAVTTTPEKAK